MRRRNPQYGRSHYSRTIEVARRLWREEFGTAAELPGIVVQSMVDLALGPRGFRRDDIKRDITYWVARHKERDLTDVRKVA